LFGWWFRPRYWWPARWASTTWRTANGLLEEALEAHAPQAHRLAIGQLAAHRHDVRHRQLLGLPDELGDALAIQVREVQVEQEHMRLEALALEPGLEGARGDADFVVGLLGENLGERGGDFALVVGDQHAGAPGRDALHGNAMGPHELEQLAHGDAAVFRARDAVALQAARVEPLGDGSRGDIADLGDFTGGQHVFFDWHGLHLVL
jgi:hypothetical protein